MGSYEESRRRHKPARIQMLEMLEEAGSEGVLNTQLRNVCICWHQRIGELQAKGYFIDTEPDPKKGDGVYRYFLRKSPSSEAYPELAEDILFKNIKRDFGDYISSHELENLLKDLGFAIRRRSGYFRDQNERNYEEYNQED